jgi:Fe-S-cluster-containing hydrogenase component 2
MGKDKIDVFGEKVEDVKISHFQFPALSQPDWKLPRLLSKVLKNALTSKPVIDMEVCKSCNRCAEICPPQALAREGKNLFFDYGQCIRCLCCLEVCPEGAISIKQGWALRMVGKRVKVNDAQHKTPD